MEYPPPQVIYYNCTCMYSVLVDFMLQQIALHLRITEGNVEMTKATKLLFKATTTKLQIHVSLISCYCKIKEIIET